MLKEIVPSGTPGGWGAESEPRVVVGGPAAEPGLSKASLFCVLRRWTSELQRRSASHGDPERRVGPGSWAGPRNADGRRAGAGVVRGPHAAGGRGRWTRTPRPKSGLPRQPGVKVRVLSPPSDAAAKALAAGPLTLPSQSWGPSHPTPPELLGAPGAPCRPAQSPAVSGHAPGAPLWRAWPGRSCGVRGWLPDPRSVARARRDQGPPPRPHDGPRRALKAAPQRLEARRYVRPGPDSRPEQSHGG